MTSRTLFIDLASNVQTIALVTNERTVAAAVMESRTGEQHLIPQIDALLEEARWTMQDLTRIAAVTGPGGFMSLRVGISLANALGDGLNLPLAGIHLSDLFAARVPKDEPCLWVHSTKQDLLFVRGLGAGADAWKEPTLEKVSDLAAMLRHDTAYAGELIDAQQARLPMLRRKEDVAPLQNVLPEFLRTLTYEKKSLLPWYGRGG